ncbi:MAG TPA: aldolase/citrate lyase family protein [Acidimicrobiales bacterium]|nr:aldolase/citrate lyase family protein [Acidimicrobiales bacterium]
MPHPTLVQRWSEGLPAFGGWLTTDSESTIQSFGRLGYDYVGIDTQHTVLSDAQAAVLVRRLSDPPFAVIVRVAKNDSALIGRVLDAGADGVIVPMVNTAEEAASAVSACRYPPDGVRSFGPMRADLGLDLQQLQERVSCFVMIETSQGLENVHEICAVPGLAGVYIGPADLSIGLGLNPMLAFSSDQLEEPVKRIEAACSKFDVVMGAHSLNGTNAARWASRGARLVSLGADSVMFATIAAQELETARKGAP